MHPYQHADGRPRIRNSWVLYLDALGTKDRAATLTDDILRERLRPEAWYHRFLFHGNQAEHRRALYFTDNIVIGVPADDDARHPAVTLTELLTGAASYVVGMAIEAGIAVRGGIAFGPAYIDDVVLHDPLASVQAAHGSALVEAVHLEETKARVPRVIIGSSVIAEVQRLASEPGAAVIPPTYWLRDDEGLIFLDHLGLELLFEPTMATDMPRADLLTRYANFVNAGLTTGGAPVGKYEWLANYHDAIVQQHGVGVPIRDRPPRLFAPATS
jgi:hypothetical protein